MLSKKPKKRPNCENTLKLKNSWVLNEEEMHISEEMKDFIESKGRKKKFTIYTILKSKLRLTPTGLLSLSVIKKLYNLYPFLKNHK